MKFAFRIKDDKSVIIYNDKEEVVRFQTFLHEFYNDQIEFTDSAVVENTGTTYGNVNYQVNIKTKFYGTYSFTIQHRFLESNFRQKLDEILECLKGYYKLINKDYFILDTEDNSLTTMVKNDNQELINEIEKIKEEIKDLKLEKAKVIKI